MRTSSPLLLTALILGCTEYDLGRDNDLGPKNDADTGYEPPDPDNPDIRVEPASLDFGYVLKDCPSTQVITISNVGGDTLVVDAVEIGGANAGGYSETGEPLELEPGATAEVEVTFQPTAWIDYSAQVEVRSNDPDAPEVAVPLAGVGSEDAYYEDVFQQGEGGRPVDILWVVDNSGSMSNKIEIVKEQFDYFTSDFVEMDLDFHMGAITTDMGSASDQGRLRGNPRWFDASEADPVGAFGATMDEIFRQQGSNDEKGLATTEAALTDPLASGHNAGFRRSTDSAGNPVALHTIVVSDEDDSSSWSSSGFTSFYEGLASDDELSVFSAICGDPGSGGMFDGGCMEWTSQGPIEASPGTKYYEVARDSGGHWASICTIDLSEELTHLSIVSQGLSVQFFLTHEPSSIALTSVEVNGSEVGYSAIDGWTYTSTDMAITFHGDAIPPESATIRVSYPFDGDC
jgi:hypothetical protein